MLIGAPAELLLALWLAMALDGLIGDPEALCRRLPHPVMAIGGAVGRLEARLLDAHDPPRRQYLAGLAATLLIVGACVALGLALHMLARALPLGWALEGMLMSTLLAQRGLYDHVAAVADGLERGLDEGRLAVSAIVGRDPDSLDRHAVARAAIESAAENLSDGVVAPLLHGLLMGLPGMLAYKAINTMDSMIGHRSPRHLHFGRFAARLDDLANLVPARLTAALIVIAALVLPSSRPGAGLRSALRDARRHRSPNAGWPEAALAGCLGLRLAGPRRYGAAMIDDAWMGDGRAEAEPSDIRRALAHILAVCALLWALVGAGLVPWERLSGTLALRLGGEAV